MGYLPVVCLACGSADFADGSTPDFGAAGVLNGVLVKPLLLLGLEGLGTSDEALLFPMTISFYRSDASLFPAKRQIEVDFKILTLNIRAINMIPNHIDGSIRQD